MIEVLHKSRVAALASLDVFLAVLRVERDAGRSSREVETAFFADFHDKLSDAFFWGAGTNGSDKTTEQKE